MRFVGIVLEELELNGDGGGDFIVPATEDLIDALDAIRKDKGFTDLVGNCDNDVYYNFYLRFNPATKEIELSGTANEADEDDWQNYIIDISPEEKEQLMFYIIDALAKEIEY